MVATIDWPVTSWPGTVLPTATPSPSTERRAPPTTPPTFSKTAAVGSSAYVKMSRARERTTVYAVADDIEQAKADLRREWGSERRQRWAIDTGTPITDPVAVERTYEIAPETAAALRLARIDRERDVLLRSIPTPPDLVESAEGQRTRWMGEHPDVKMRLELMAFERGQLARTLDPAHERAAPSMSR